MPFSLLRLGFRRRNRFWLIVTGTIFIFFLGPKFTGTGEHSHYREEDVLDFRLDRYRRYQETENNRKGPGEHGEGHTLTGVDTRLLERRKKEEGMNIMVSDQIALDRSLKDVRPRRCRNVTYPKDLPSLSVIIIYFNEAWSPILRTVHSVINRTPPQYLHEVILLDDSSTRPELLDPLNSYIKETWPDGIVHVVRTPERLGLIGARQFGAEAASGDVIFFLDAHCEATAGWAEPILARIKEKRTAVLCPTIDSIDGNSLSFGGMGGHARGGFSWAMHFTWWYKTTVTSPTKDIEPYSSPTMAGGLVAIDRKYFFELGGYDTKMEIWGGENLEMSFRVWMCGGSLEFVPCSHVGHIFRATHPYGFPDKKRDYHGINSKRLVEVWLGEYKRYFYMFRPDLVNVDHGDVTDRQQLRDQLGCRDFRWYMNNVFPEKFVFDENVTGWGQVRNPSTNYCFDTLNADEKHTIMLGLYHCHKKIFSSQVFSLNVKRELRRETICLDAYQNRKEKNVIQLKMTHCHGQGGHQDWHYNAETKQLILHDTNDCITVPERSHNAGKTYPVLAPCSATNDRQMWEFNSE